MEGAHEELERRSKFLNSLIQKKKDVEHKKQNDRMNVRVRASDMPLSLQNHAFRFARDNLDSMASGKLDSKRLALALKKVVFDVKFSTAVKVFTGRPNYSFYTDPDPGKFLANGAEEFDSTYGPAWHCIVGTSFGSYVTHSVGGFLYFSMDNVYILLFKTAVEPLDI